MSKPAKRKMVKIELEELKLLCLNVDYKVKGEVQDMIEELSLDCARAYKFDTHKFRMQLAKQGFKGAL